MTRLGLPIPDRAVRFLVLVIWRRPVYKWRG